MEPRDRGAVLPGLAVAARRALRPRRAGCSRSRAVSRSPRSCGCRSCTTPRRPRGLLRHRHPARVDPHRRRAGGVGRAAGTRGAWSPASHPRSRGVEFGRAPRVRVAAPRRFLHGALPRRAVPHRARGGVCDRRRRAPAARRHQPRALVRSAVRARTHQLRRLPVALADLRVARRATHAPRRLGARHAAHRRSRSRSRRSPTSCSNSRSATARSPLGCCDPRFRRSSACSLSASCSRPRRRHARSASSRTRYASRCRSPQSSGCWWSGTRSRCSSPTRASRRCPRTRASTC